MRLYRDFEAGEFIVVAADTSSGMGDYCAAQFISKTKFDIPLVYQAHGVAVQMTSEIMPVIEKIYDITRVQPLVGLERAAGGASELDRLAALNRSGKYKMYIGKYPGRKEAISSGKYGWDVTGYSRGQMLGDLKDFIDKHILAIYDEPTINELFSFIEVYRAGRWQGEAEKGQHDDLCMSMAGGVMMWQGAQKPTEATNMQPFSAWDDSFTNKYR